MPFLYQMNIEVGNIIKTLLEPFEVGGSGTNQFIDKLAGVVQVISKSERTESEGQVIKTFPISCNTTFEECNKLGAYKDLVPNSKYGCMVYLEEEGGVNFESEDRNGKKYNTSFLLVGWINQKKLGSSSCSITGSIINTLIIALQKKPFNSGIYNSIKITISEQNPKSINPFSKYTYDQDNTQYLMAPFDYFSLKVDVSFIVNPYCIVPFEKEAELSCNN